MKLRAHPRWLVALLLLMAAAAGRGYAQVFTVGEHSATADINADFTPTRVELPQERMGERTMRELMRDLEAEQGFAHRVLPLGGIFTLEANGNLAPGPEAYRKLIYQKGKAADQGDRVAITKLEIKPETIVVDINGGPYPPHRFLSHVQVGVGNVMAGPTPQAATGCRVILHFEGGTPAVSAPEVKALLEPIIDFRAKTGEVAYAETLPAPIQSAVASHEVLVGMNRRMVLASMGQPESKVREGSGAERYEEWIYGHQPQPVQFVRIVGDRVTQVKVAAVGKPIVVRTRNEVEPEAEPATVANVGDVKADGATKELPSLRKPGEQLPEQAQGTAGQHKVQYPPPAKPSGTSPQQ